MVVQKQDTYTLHKPVRYRFKRNRVIVHEEYVADLAIIYSLSKQNIGFRYILTVIDVLSKYAWVEHSRKRCGNISLQRTR